MVFNLGLILALAVAAIATPFPAPAAVAPPATDIGDIVGGTAATTGEFPYQVALIAGGSLFCGGVLINSRTVLTAAHCSVSYSASSVSVRAGSLTWASGGTLVRVSQIVVHPSYNSGTTNNDVALWHLSTALPASSTIGYVTLPAQGSDPAAGTSVITSGWGLTSESGSTIPAALRKVTVAVVARATCQSNYGGASVVTTNMFCAAAAGKDSCSGDSGGPIVNAATRVLLGTVSWGQGCAQARYPGVYSRIGNYVTWIGTNKWTT